MYDKNNVFAKIIRGELPCGKVAETKHSMAFDDLHPQARVHVLVVPKGGYKSIADFVEKATVAEKEDFWNLVLAAADSKGARDNFRAVANTGQKAGQTIPHFHVHILSD